MDEYISIQVVNTVVIIFPENNLKKDVEFLFLLDLTIRFVSS